MWEECPSHTRRIGLAVTFSTKYINHWWKTSAVIQPFLVTATVPLNCGLCQDDIAWTPLNTTKGSRTSPAALMAASIVKASLPLVAVTLEAFCPLGATICGSIEKKN